MSDSLPPFDATAEEAVLAALLLDEDAMAQVKRTGLMASEFFREHNGWWFAAAERMWERGETITMPGWFAEMGELLDKAGGEPYMTEIWGNNLMAVGCETHAMIVRRCAYQRSVISMATTIAKQSYSAKANQKDIDGLWRDSVESVLALRPPGSDGMVRIWDASVETSYGAPWDIPVLDRLTNGVAPGKLTIIAGGTGQGKSMLAGQIATNYAAQMGRALIFTKEMGEGEYRQRIESRLMAAGNLPPVEALDIHLKNRRVIDVPYIRAETQYHDGERLHDGAPAPILVVIDYLQLMHFSGSDKESEATRIGKTTTGLKDMAVEMGCHVVLLTQYSREGSKEQRVGWGVTDHCLLNMDQKFNAPFNESFKGSSSIEQDADHTIQIVRHTREFPHPCNGHVDIYLTKNRSGRVGRCFAYDDFSNARFRFFENQNEAYREGGSTLGLAHKICVDQNLVQDG